MAENRSVDVSMAQLACDEVFAVVEPLVVPAEADHPLVLVVVAGVVVVVDLDVDEDAVADDVVGAAAVVEALVAEVDVPAIHAPRLTVATTLTTAAAIRDRWAARRRGRRGDAVSWIMGFMIRDARKTATNPM
jgi:hypothetical protein